MRSPLEVTYDEIVKNPYLCVDNPLGRHPDWNGDLLLWEGNQNPKDKNSAVFRVVLKKDKSLRYLRYNKRDGEWVPVKTLEPRRFFRRKDEEVPPGVIRIEVFANGRVKRTPNN